MHARPIGLFVSAACGLVTGSITLVATDIHPLRWSAIALVVLFWRKRYLARTSR